MVTKAIFQEAGITVENELLGNAALEWMKENTKLEFDPADVSSLTGLTAGAKFFIQKYEEVMSLSAGITSESIAGMSQSFDTDKTSLLLKYARDLIGSKYVTGGLASARFVPAKKHWM